MATTCRSFEWASHQNTRLTPRVHKDLLVIRGDAPELFSFEIVTRSKLKSSLFIINFLQLFFSVFEQVYCKTLSSEFVHNYEKLKKFLS